MVEPSKEKDEDKDKPLPRAVQSPARSQLLISDREDLTAGGSLPTAVEQEDRRSRDGSSRAHSVAVISTRASESREVALTTSYSPRGPRESIPRPAATDVPSSSKRRRGTESPYPVQDTQSLVVSKPRDRASRDNSTRPSFSELPPIPRSQPAASTTPSTLTEPRESRFSEITVPKTSFPGPSQRLTSHPSPSAPRSSHTPPIGTRSREATPNTRSTSRNLRDLMRRDVTLDRQHTYQLSQEREYRQSASPAQARGTPPIAAPSIAQTLFEGTPGKALVSTAPSIQASSANPRDTESIRASPGAPAASAKPHDAGSERTFSDRRASSTRPRGTESHSRRGSSSRPRAEARPSIPNIHVFPANPQAPMDYSPTQRASSLSVKRPHPESRHQSAEAESRVNRPRLDHVSPEERRSFSDPVLASRPPPPIYPLRFPATWRPPPTSRPPPINSRNAYHDNHARDLSPLEMPEGTRIPPPVGMKLKSTKARSDGGKRRSGAPNSDSAPSRQSTAYPEQSTEGAEPPFLAGMNEASSSVTPGHAAIYTGRLAAGEEHRELPHSPHYGRLASRGAATGYMGRATGFVIEEPPPQFAGPSWYRPSPVFNGPTIPPTQYYETEGPPTIYDLGPPRNYESARASRHSYGPATPPGYYNEAAASQRSYYGADGLRSASYSATAPPGFYNEADSPRRASYEPNAPPTSYFGSNGQQPGLSRPPTRVGSSGTTPRLVRPEAPSTKRPATTEEAAPAPKSKKPATTRKPPSRRPPPPPPAFPSSAELDPLVDYLRNQISDLTNHAAAEAAQVEIFRLRANSLRDDLAALQARTTRAEDENTHFKAAIQQLRSENEKVKGDAEHVNTLGRQTLQRLWFLEDRVTAQQFALHNHEEIARDMQNCFKRFLGGPKETKKASTKKNATKEEGDNEEETESDVGNGKGKGAARCNGPGREWKREEPDDEDGDDNYNPSGKRHCSV